MHFSHLVWSVKKKLDITVVATVFQPTHRSSSTRFDLFTLFMRSRERHTHKNQQHIFPKRHNANNVNQSQCYFRLTLRDNLKNQQNRIWIWIGCKRYYGNVAVSLHCFALCSMSARVHSPFSWIFNLIFDFIYFFMAIWHRQYFYAQTLRPCFS